MDAASNSASDFDFEVVVESREEKPHRPKIADTVNISIEYDLPRAHLHAHLQPTIRRKLCVSTACGVLFWSVAIVFLVQGWDRVFDHDNTGLRWFKAYVVMGTMAYMLDAVVWPMLECRYNKSGVLHDVIYMVDESTAHAHFAHLIAASPTIIFEVECSHTVTTRDDFGNENTRNMVTWKGCKRLGFDGWTDNSAAMPSIKGDLLPGRKMMKCSAKMGFKASDERTSRSIKEQKSKFISSNAHRDVVSKGFEPKVLLDDSEVEHDFIIVPDGTSFSLRLLCFGTYALSVICGVFFLYRIFMEYYVYDIMEWHCEKVVATQPLPHHQNNKQQGQAQGQDHRPSKQPNRKTVLTQTSKLENLSTVRKFNFVGDYQGGSFRPVQHERMHEEWSASLQRINAHIKVKDLMYWYNNIWIAGVPVVLALGGSTVFFVFIIKLKQGLLFTLSVLGIQLLIFVCVVLSLEGWRHLDHKVYRNNKVMVDQVNRVITELNVVQLNSRCQWKWKFVAPLVVKLPALRLVKLQCEPELTLVRISKG